VSLVVFIIDIKYSSGYYSTHRKHLNRRGGHPLLTRTDIITIILQDNEIKRLTARNERLETACKGLFDVNDRLRVRIRELEGRKPELANVNI
jgi:hypothetical protein